jgi:hypothetical protein
MTALFLSAAPTSIKAGALIALLQSSGGSSR